MLSPHSVLFLFIQMHHDEMGVRSDSLTFQFIYVKRRPSFLLKLILVMYLFQFGRYFNDLWQLFQPKLSEPQISMHHNKQVICIFWTCS